MTSKSEKISEKEFFHLKILKLKKGLETETYMEKSLFSTTKKKVENSHGVFHMKIFSEG